MDQFVTKAGKGAQAQKPGPGQKTTIEAMMSAVDTALLTQFIEGIAGQNFGWLAFQGSESPIQVIEKLKGKDINHLITLFSVMKIRGNKIWKYQNETGIGPQLTMIVTQLDLFVSDPKKSNGNAGRKNRPQTVQIAFPTVMGIVSAYIESNYAELVLTHQENSALPVTHRWIGSLCNYGTAQVVNGQNHVNVHALIVFIQNYIKYYDGYINARKFAGRTNQEKQEVARMKALSWMGKLLETYSPATTRMFNTSRNVNFAAVQAGGFNDNLRKTICDALEMNIWAQIPTKRGETSPADEVRRALHSVYPAGIFKATQEGQFVDVSTF